MFDKVMLLMEEYDANKILDNYTFSQVLIWVRVVGEGLEMDVVKENKA
jgi:hypothetical protein